MRAAIRQILFAESPFRPSQLFASGEQGAWYDQTVTASLAQDAAGTTAAAMEQAVGLMRDQSGRGNNASQTTLAARPVLSARVNALTYTEQLNDASWTKNGATITQNAIAAPDGTSSADLILETNVTQQFFVRQFPAPSGLPFVVSFYAKRQNRDFVVCRNDSGSGWAAWNLATGAVAGTGQAAITQTIAPVGNDWFLCVATYGVGAFGSSAQINIGPQIAANFTAYAGNSANGVYVWAADVRSGNDVIGIPGYQRVAAATDYDTAGFPQRVQYDRVDDSHTVAAGGGSTTAFFFCAAIRLSTVGQIQTLYSDTGTNTGYRIRINASNQLEMAVGNGLAYTTVNTIATFAINERAVITCWHDGTNIYAQKNRGAVASAAFGTAAAGTAGFTLGSDNGAASNFFGGGLYQYIHTKDVYKGDSARAKAQAFCAAKALVTL